MSDVNLLPLDVDNLLSKLNTKDLVKPAVFLGGGAIAAILTFIIILIHAIFTKLDSNTEYSIHVYTQAVQYQPYESTIPAVNLSEFRLLKNLSDCPSLAKGEWYKKGELTFYKESKVTLRLTQPNNIQLNVEPKFKSARLAQLITNKGRCVVKEKLSIDIKLTERSPDFIMILVGNITLGQTLSFATHPMPLFLVSGQIEVKDASFWFKDPISLPTVYLGAGDTVLIPSDEESAATGLLTISLDDDAMAGVFNKKGGEIRIVKPFASNEGSPIAISFFERLYSDNALTIALSISFIVTQVLMFLITTLIRLTYIPKNSTDTPAQPTLSINDQNLNEKDSRNETTD